MCWACSIGSVQSNKTWSAGNPQAVWCFGYAIFVLSSPTRPGLLEMLRQCGVLGMQYWFCLAQQGLVCWKCSGNVVFRTCIVSALSSPTRPGLLEMLRQCGVLGMQYWLCPVQQDLVCWKSSGSVVFWVRSICSV